MGCAVTQSQVGKPSTGVWMWRGFFLSPLQPQGLWFMSAITLAVAVMCALLTTVKSTRFIITVNIEHLCGLVSGWVLGISFTLPERLGVAPATIYISRFGADKHGALMLTPHPI
jgi:hypothetical protein